MNLREIRLGLTRYPDDSLDEMAKARFPEKIASYPLRGVTSQKVGWLLETAERSARLVEVESAANSFTGLLRDFLSKGFSRGDLYEFLFDTPAFRELANSLGSDRTPKEYVTGIIEFCEQSPERYPELFAWARNKNPQRYTLNFLSW